MEDVKVREMQIFDYKKKIAEAETKLKQQQNLYEAVRSDRNLYSKNLIESQVSYNVAMSIYFNSNTRNNINYPQYGVVPRVSDPFNILDIMWSCNQ